MSSYQHVDIDGDRLEIRPGNGGGVKVDSFDAATEHRVIVAIPAEEVEGLIAGIRAASATPGSITTGNQESAQTIEITPTPWTEEEREHYNRTGETPLARLHRENLAAQWSGDA